MVGPPVLLADGFTAIEIDGRRLAVVGMILIGAGDALRGAQRLVGDRADPRRLGGLARDRDDPAAFNIKLSLSGGPLVAQIIVLTMPAASHLAIHFRDDRRREADPRVAARLDLARPSRSPILWTAITGAIGYGALVTSDVVPIQQFGAILGICTLIAALLVMALSPIAMLPPFPLEMPVRHGSRSRVAGAMNRLTVWVYDHPRTIVAAVAALVDSPLARDVPAYATRRTTSTCSGPRPGSCRITTPSRPSSAGSAWSS